MEQSAKETWKRLLDRARVRLPEPTLRTWLEPAEAVSTAWEIASALDAAHTKGLVHGDLKAADIVLTPGGVRVHGFGSSHFDPTRSEVIDRDRGFFTRVGDAFSDDSNNERDLYVLAGKKVSAAAKESNLRVRAEENTTLMLEGLLGRLGYTDVHIVFEKPAPPTSSTS